MQLVEIKKLDLVTNSAVIATGVKKDHKPVIQLIEVVNKNWPPS